MLNKNTDNVIYWSWWWWKHYSGQDGNFSCCCECLRGVVAILNLCCCVFFRICGLKLQEHAVSPSRRLRWRLFACYTSSGYFMCFLFLPLDCISLQATALTEARNTHVHTQTKTKQQQNKKHSHVSPRNSSRNFLCSLSPGSRQVRICAHLSVRHFASVAATQRRSALQPRVTPHSPSISCALTLPVPPLLPWFKKQPNERSEVTSVTGIIWSGFRGEVVLMAVTPVTKSRTSTQKEKQKEIKKFTLIYVCSTKALCSKDKAKGNFLLLPLPCR